LHFKRGSLGDEKTWFRRNEKTIFITRNTFILPQIHGERKYPAEKFDKKTRGAFTLRGSV